jgi:hypothetical protein
VAEGSAETVSPELAERPVGGDHIYEVPPSADKTTDCPLQSTGADGLAKMKGSGLTVTFTEAVLEHPFASVPVTI